MVGCKGNAFSENGIPMASDVLNSILNDYVKQDLSTKEKRCRDLLQHGRSVVSFCKSVSILFT